jgi:hypothetical protein
MNEASVRFGPAARAADTKVSIVSHAWRIEPKALISVSDPERGGAFDFVICS